MTASISPTTMTNDDVVIMSVNQLRDLTRTILKQPDISANVRSRSSYTRTTERLLRINKTPIQHARTLGTFCHYRSAWVYYHRLKIRELWAHGQSPAVNGDSGQMAATVQAIGNHVIALLDYDAKLNFEETPGRSEGLWERKCLQMKLAGVKVVSHSKRHLNAKLPNGWKDEILAHAQNAHSVHADAIAVLSACGCRPDEVEKGVVVKASGNQEIEIQISGSKTHGGKYGQAQRSFTLPVNSLATRALYKLASENKGIVKVSFKAQSLSMAVTRISKILWPAPKSVRPSAYSFRHAFSSDLKSDGEPPKVVAKALGHCTDETLGYYARATRTGGGRGIKNVEATTEPREIVANKIAKLSFKGDTDNRG